MSGADALHALGRDLDDLQEGRPHPQGPSILSTRPTSRPPTAFPPRSARIGNIRSDGRPILGLDSRNLLEITLESDPGAYLIPAHIWTPWFAALGSKSGFDSIEACYGDLTPHIFAVETGLSSDPSMNWRLSQLDRYRLVSNSDAHSPPKLGREATPFDTDLDYFAIRRALETGDGFGGTVEFFPEEGKYHARRPSQVQCAASPAETLANGGRCPVCGEPTTVGVLHRVEELADRAEEEVRPPPTAGEVSSLVPLAEVISEIASSGVQSKTVGASYDRLVSTLGAELDILEAVPVEDIARNASPLLAEAITRLRAGQVFAKLATMANTASFACSTTANCAAAPPAICCSMRSRTPRGRRKRRPPRAPGASPGQPGRQRPLPRPPPPVLYPAPTSPSCPRLRLTLKRSRPCEARSPRPRLRFAAARRSRAHECLSCSMARACSIRSTTISVCGGSGGWSVLIVAGPGSGKTRTLTYRMAHLIAERGVPPSACLAITFTRRAAAEMRERLAALLRHACPDAPSTCRFTRSTRSA